MAVDEGDLRLRLKFTNYEWTSDDAAFATAAINSAEVVVKSVAGPDAVAAAVADNDTAKLAAVDEATLAYAALLFANPERVMQRRSGADSSVSFSDSSTAALGLAEVERILSGYFTLARANSSWLSNEVVGSDEWLPL